MLTVAELDHEIVVSLCSEPELDQDLFHDCVRSSFRQYRQRHNTAFRRDEYILEGYHNNVIWIVDHCSKTERLAFDTLIAYTVDVLPHVAMSYQLTLKLSRKIRISATFLNFAALARQVCDAYRAQPPTPGPLRTVYSLCAGSYRAAASEIIDILIKRAHGEIRSKGMLTLGTRCSADLIEMLIESAIVAEDVPLRPWTVGGFLGPAYSSDEDSE